MANSPSEENYTLRVENCLKKATQSDHTVDEEETVEDKIILHCGRVGSKEKDSTDELKLDIVTGLGRIAKRLDLDADIPGNNLWWLTSKHACSIFHCRSYFVYKRNIGVSNLTACQ